jgi:hypothetical protein
MKPASTPILALISTLLLTIVVCALLGRGTALAAVVDPFVVTIQQVGSNVEATSNANGGFNFSTMTLVTQSRAGAGGNVFPSAGAIQFSSPGDFVVNYEGLKNSGPASFGSGGFTDANSPNGPVPFVGFAVSMNGPFVELFVPQGYTSDTALPSEQDIFSNTTLAMLGITPGKNTWIWGGGEFADESFTIDVIAPTTTTPLPATLPLFATGLGALGLLGWRRKRKARVNLLGAA